MLAHIAYTRDDKRHSAACEILNIEDLDTALAEANAVSQRSREDMMVRVNQAHSGRRYTYEEHKAMYEKRAETIKRNETLFEKKHGLSYANMALFVNEFQDKEDFLGVAKSLVIEVIEAIGLKEVPRRIIKWIDAQEGGNKGNSAWRNGNS